jgi:hypothetical protein
MHRIELEFLGRYIVLMLSEAFKIYNYPKKKKKRKRKYPKELIHATLVMAHSPQVLWGNGSSQAWCE